MTIKFGEFRDCVTDRPTQDGNYLILGFNAKGEFFSGANVFYTVEGGWNTTPNHYDHAISYADSCSDGYRYYWLASSDVTMENDNGINA